MAKKPLKPPSVPPGARHSFFVYMQGLVVDNGDLSTPQLGRLLDYSHQAVYKALTGPRMPSRAMAANLAKVVGGEAAAKTALRLWSAGVHEERGLAETAVDDSADHEPPAAPTALDIARVILGDNERAATDEVARRRWSLPARPGYRARAALAAEMRGLAAEVGAVADWFICETTRRNLSDWLCGRAIPSLHNLVNFGYELRLDEAGWTQLLGLHTAAVAEARANTSWHVAYPE
ncbi:hypothetical protein [Nocardia pseudobrasiliensis]|uniref:Uncharacterized protein n=1 Tax=Nocardia pseudobrasiliensis TaxID=45979 RepID=A0A370IE20_9NOCA|nr:hypothetical protein [Nocardia pseudobrasiliensis]RDI68966.1 hypothetical protein DFR76_101503 [Nocardia pseudobrasiliensis]